MKKLLFFLCACFICLVSTKAQSLTDVVYLKSGSVIRGTIIEQVPNESIKIQTSDGSIFAYPMADVQKMTKEQAIGVSHGSSGSTFRNDFAAKKGYKGFVELGGGIGIGDWAGGYAGLTTSHGYQFNPYIFAGAGVGVNYDFGNEIVFIPIFADFKFNILNSNISPIIGSKIGYSVYDGKGVFFNPSLGCRFGLSESFALSVSFNYTLQGATVWYRYSGHYYEDNVSLHTLGLKLGFDF